MIVITHPFVECLVADIRLPPRFHFFSGFLVNLAVDV